MTGDAVVRTAGGLVRGRRDREGFVFAGIPYAPNPEGAARFAAPGPAPTWQGVRDATTASATAPFLSRALGRIDLSPVLGEGWQRSGDDYLTVTVSTPGPSARGLPVLVFLHGGGFTAGSGHAALYAGDTFSRDGVVLVTVNYRLGIAGWLDLPDAPPNRGLRDVIAALRWVAGNIARFGGDPGAVTVAGQSAGAMIVSTLFATPSARGLFRRAISQSGSGEPGYVPDQAALVTAAVSTALGSPATAAALSALSDEALLALTTRLPPIDQAAHGFVDRSLANSPFKPVIDGDLVTMQPVDAVRTGAGDDVDLLLGTNTDEANLYSVPLGEPGDDATMLAAARRRFAEPETTIEYYRDTYPTETPAQLTARLITEAFRQANLGLLDARAARAGVRTFGYEFRWRSSAFDDRLGACHCVELPFVFDRLDLPALRTEHGLLGPATAPAELAARTHAAWVGFVRDGDPGWPLYRGDVVVLDAHPVTSGR